MMKKTSMLTAMVAIIATFAFSAQAMDDPVKKRQNAMESIAKAVKMSSRMVKGTLPYNQATASGAMKTISEAGERFGQYFPKGSNEDPDSEASEKIWTDRKGFDDLLSKFNSDAKKAMDVASAGPAPFKAAFMDLVKNCKSCHDGYRIEK
jgi:cytochrome c556